MTTDIYPEMCRTSPVQKEWNVNQGDFYVDEEGIHILPAGASITEASRELYKRDGIWLPRQEDWQEIYYNQYEIKDVDAYLNIFDELPKTFDIVSEDACFELMNSHITSSGIWTLLWCLFVHKEVYGLMWDWEEKKWKKE